MSMLLPFQSFIGELDKFSFPFQACVLHVCLLFIALNFQPRCSNRLAEFRSETSLNLRLFCYIYFLVGREIKAPFRSRFLSFKHDMGCFTVLKSRKKKSDRTTYFKSNKDPKDHSPAALPEPHYQTRSLQSAPPSFKTRVKPVQAAYEVTSSRMRTLSAPSTLDAAEQDALSSVEFDEIEDSRYRVSSKEQQQQSPNPQPLPLPSPQAQSTATLKPMGSFKSVSSSGPLYTSGPLPLPPLALASTLATLRNFSYDEISAACHNFSSDRCISEGLSFVTYKASFGDDASGSKKFEATVTRLQTSFQVTV